MSFDLRLDVPHGNARAVQVQLDGDLPEVEFAANPHGGPEALWFCFRLVSKTPAPPPGARVRLTLKYADVALTAAAADLQPVYRPAEQGWHRAGGAVVTQASDGQARLSWVVPFPAPTLDVAWCFPYGKPEVSSLLDKSKGYWRSDEIGLSPVGRPLMRLSNEYGSPGGARQGLYLLARQRGGETPGSWVLDGALQFFSRVRKHPFLIWCVPLADVDGVTQGRQGKDAYPYDLNRAWTTPPLLHECQVLQQDLVRWQGRCRPALLLDFHAAGAGDAAGFACLLPAVEATAAVRGDAEKWANIVNQELGADYAAPDFKRTWPPRSGEASALSYAAEKLGVPALALLAPYGRSGPTVLAQKHYREVGERVARALVRRVGGG
jgi:hypothetical protein